MTQVSSGIGGHPCLELLNTDAVVEGRAKDRLRTVDQLQAWCQENGIAEAAGGKVTLAFAHRLRAAWRAALDPTTTGAAAWAAVDAVLAEAPGHLSVADSDEPVLTSDTPGGRVRAALAAATAAIVLEDWARIRTCAADDCSLVFLDTSRAGRRRWCSMATCGTRAKLATRAAGR